MQKKFYLCFFRTVTFSQLLFQSSFSLRAKPLQITNLFLIAIYLGQLLFETAIFLEEKLLRKK